MRASAATAPTYARWVERSHVDYAAACAAIEQRDFDALAEVSESSCLKMHAVMLTTDPPLLYWNAATLAVLEAIRALKADGVAVFFTIDAGPQVKAVCAPEAADRVAATLAALDGVDAVLRSHVGGPLRVTRSS